MRERIRPRPAKFGAARALAAWRDSFGTARASQKGPLSFCATSRAEFTGTLSCRYPANTCARFPPSPQGRWWNCRETLGRLLDSD